MSEFVAMVVAAVVVDVQAYHIASLTAEFSTPNGERS
jgi:hypothetical protein